MDENEYTITVEWCNLRLCNLYIIWRGKPTWVEDAQSTANMTWVSRFNEVDGKPDAAPVLRSIDPDAAVKWFEDKFNIKWNRSHYKCSLTTLVPGESVTVIPELFMDKYFLRKTCHFLDIGSIYAQA